MKRLILWCAPLCLAATFACKKSAPASSAPADAGGAADAAAEPEQESLGASEGVDLDELAEQVDRFADELAGLTEEASPEAAGDEGRCARICEIAAAVCDLQARICELAAEHEGEERYAAACESAGAQCTEASAACDSCEG